jgi:hypothetical protein
LFALTAVLAVVLPSLPASAVTLPSAETRVGVVRPVTAVVVGVHECIRAGQRPVRGPSQLQVAAGSCAAAEAGAKAELPSGYSSFSAAKRDMGSPGQGNVFDHVVEQSQIRRSGFAPDESVKRRV